MLLLTTGFVSPFIFACLLFFFIVTVAIAYDSGVVATVVLLAFGAIGWWMSWISIDWALAHWIEVLIGIAAYVPAGIAWTIVKWRFYLKSRYRDAVAMLNTSKSLPQYDYPPQVANHKRDIMRWLAWWPFSFVGTMLDDPLRRFFLMIYRHLGKVLQRMSDRMFSDLKPPPRS